MSKYDIIVKAIKEIGFPIVACCGLFWLCVDIIAKNTAAIQALTEAITRL